MSDGRDQLEQRLDRAFSALRPRAGFEAELLGRIRRQPEPGAARPPRLAGGRWAAWAGAAAAAAAVLLVGVGGYFVVHSRPAGRASTASSEAKYSTGVTAPAGGPAAAARFGKLPRPQAATPPIPVPAASGFSGASISGRAAPLSADSVAPGGQALVQRYREPAPSEMAAFAARLGAAGTGGRYTGADFSLVLFATDPTVGLPAHYVLTPNGPQPSGAAPSPAAAQAAAAAFLAARGLDAGLGPAVLFHIEGPLGIVTYANGTTVFVRGDGGIFQASGPTGVDLQQATYRVASSDQLRAAAQAPPGATPRFETVLAGDGRYWYLEPAAVFGSVVVPAVDPALLR